MHVSKKLSILSVTSELPWPLDTGGKIRTFHLQRALATAFDVRLVVPVGTGTEKAITKLRDNGINIIAVPVGPKRKIKEIGKALTAMVLGKPYVLYRRHLHCSISKTLASAALAKKPDLLYLDHLDSHMYRSLVPDCPALIDLHNVYSLIVERYAKEQENPIKRMYFQRETILLRKVEAELSLNTDMIFAVSESEVEYNQKLGNCSVQLIPNGVDCSLYSGLPCGRNANPVKLLFLGTMSWGPNAHAATFLIKNLFPEIRKKHPNAELWIVGRNPPAEVQKFHELEGVHVTGGVPDIVPFFEQAQFLLVPLESGGGTRLKILEAFAAGLPVISTPVGVEGIEANNGEHLTIVERSGFAAKILQMIDEPVKAQQMASQARILVQSKYDWKSIGNQAVKIIQEQIRAA